MGMIQHPPDLQRLLDLLPKDISQILEAQRTEVLVAGLIVLITLALTLLFRALLSPKSGSRGSVIVLAGPCNSGKTALFLQLRDGSTHNGTVASMQENSSSVKVVGAKGRPVGSVTVLDVPGHERLRHKLEQHLKDAAAVVFVVDAVDVTPHKVEAAEELFEVLTHPSIARKKVPILLACNKMDLETEAHSVEFVRRTLEKQLDSMRKTRTSLSPESASKAAVLGNPEQGTFSFTKLRNTVTAAGISASTGKDLEAVHAFLAPYAR